MKYEPVFGDQLAFDGMMPDCEFIVGTYGYKIKDGKCFYCEKYNHKYGWSPTGDAAKALSPVIAMRRIIAEPKRWTWEDQKAGLLPDVGAKVDGGKVVFVNGFNVVTELKRGAVIVSSSKTFLNIFKPIESPEEKAERLRSEWINKAYVDFHRLGCELEVLQKEQIKQIYDALLSGELTMPNKDGE